MRRGRAYMSEQGHAADLSRYTKGRYFATMLAERQRQFVNLPLSGCGVAVMDRSSLEDLFVAEGYKLIEDAWQEHGRRTYIHDDDADRPHLLRLTRLLNLAGLQRDKTQLRAFTNRTTGELIEVEPGGAHTSGHFLHHLSAHAG
jgi:hypothetical protein